MVIYKPRQNLSSSPKPKTIFQMDLIKELYTLLKYYFALLYIDVNVLKKIVSNTPH